MLAGQDLIVGRCTYAMERSFVSNRDKSVCL
jgi:hypothetical protein